MVNYRQLTVLQEEEGEGEDHHLQSQAMVVEEGEAAVEEACCLDDSETVTRASTDYSKCVANWVAPSVVKKCNRRSDKVSLAIAA